MKKQQAGMTLIELVIVIIVLGIIAAVAAPKFADIKTDAVTAAQEGVHGNMLSAYTIAVADQKGTPSFDQFSAKVNDMTCAAATGDCVSADLDKEGGSAGDVHYQFYDDNICTNAIAAGGTSVGGYKKSTVNTTDAAGACVGMN